MCEYIIPWIGKCKKEPESEYCKEHKDLVCSSCGEKATHGCDETMGLVCGDHLCNNCEHTIGYNGDNGGLYPKGYNAHCKKGTQVYKPWFMKDNKEDKYTEYGLKHPKLHIIKETFQCKYCDSFIDFIPDKIESSWQAYGYCNVDCAANYFKEEGE